jgi:carboxyl-terminal processing protease
MILNKTRLRNAILTFVFCFSLFIPKQLGAQSDGFEIIKNLELIELITLELDKYFVDKPIPGKLMKVAIDAMLMELDPYTVLINESNIEDYRLMSTGQYGGVGAGLRSVNNQVVFSDIFENNPAHKAGIKTGDILLSIDGKSMTGKKPDEASDLLRGPKGTKIQVEIQRPFGTNMTFDITRDEVVIDDVPHFTMVGNGVGYIKLTSFSQRAFISVKTAYDELVKQGMTSLIFDLRGNGGGVLTEAVKIVNMFVPRGQEVVRTKGRIEEENKIYLTESAPVDLNIPVAVLVDGMSASASEIVAGALQDLDRAIIIGSNTFGKGLVQRVMPLKYGSQLKLTIAKYYTPSGRCVQRLDYSSRKDGEAAQAFDESQVTYFKTKNGRKVRDARGVDPDIEIEEGSYSRLTITLLLENVIFDFATKFAHLNANIESADKFKVTDALFLEFKKFISEKNITYSTESEEIMLSLLESGEREKLFTKDSPEYIQLMKIVKASIDRDIEKYKAEIIELLEDEIVARYYFEKGRVINSFKNDKALVEASNILLNADAYKKMLSGK